MEEQDQDFEPDWFEEEKKRLTIPKNLGIAALVVGALIVVAVLGGFFLGEGNGISTTGAYIVLNDNRCSECDISMVEESLSELFPGEVTEIDYNTPEGKQLYESTGVTYLPAILFTEDVKESDSYSSIERYLEEKGDYLSLRIGAEFDPTAEICDNQIDDTGNSLVDCEDETCALKLICREEKLKTLEVFVMSQCPYGTLALDAMEEVLPAFGDDIDFHIYYIASEPSDGTFSSLHGQPEVDEDIRELCVAEHYPQDYKYMDYIWCRNEDIQSADWESCAEDAGMDAGVIRTCFEGDEGKTLLSENLKVAEDLGIGASPTWLANNRYQFGGIDAETIKQGYCSMNPDLAGCEGTLSSDAQASGSCG